MMKKYNDLILLSLIVLLGAILRLDHFNLLALWNDEAAPVNILSNNFFALWSAPFEIGNNPTFIYLLKIWGELFGTSVTALRSMSIIFGLLSVIFIYWLGKLIFDNRVGIWASFLLAVNYSGIFYSFQVRPYSLIIFLTILSYYYFSRLVLGDKKKKKDVYLYILFTILGLYAHPWFYFLLPAQLITVFILNKAETKKIFIWQTVCVAISVPLLYKLLGAIYSGASSWIPKPTIYTLLETFKDFTYGAQGFYILVILLILGYLLFKRIKAKKSNFLIPLNLLIIPLFLGYFVSKFFPIYSPGRYEMVVLPGFILTIAYLFSKIKNKLFYIIVIAILIILAFFSAIKEKKEIFSYKNDERTAAEFLVKNADNNDLLIFTDFNRNTFSYYLSRMNKSKNLFQAIFSIYEIETPFVQAPNIFEKIYYIPMEKIKVVIAKAGKHSETLDYHSGFPEKNYEYIVKTIHDKKYNNIWVVYDSTRPIDQEFIDRLGSELTLVNRYNFTRTDTYSRINSILPMFFDRIEQYRY